MTAPPTADCEPLWDLDDAVCIYGPDRDLLGQHATAHEITSAVIVDHDGSYL